MAHSKATVLPTPIFVAALELPVLDALAEELAAPVAGEPTSLAVAVVPAGPVCSDVVSVMPGLEPDAITVDGGLPLLLRLTVEDTVPLVTVTAEYATVVALPSRPLWPIVSTSPLLSVIAPSWPDKVVPSTTATPVLPGTWKAVIVVLASVSTAAIE